MKIYVKADTNDNADITEYIGDFACVIHPDRTVDCFQFYVRRNPEEAIYPTRTIKKKLKEKYGNDLIFLDDVEATTPINSIEEAEQIILNANYPLAIHIYNANVDERVNRLKNWLINPNSTGTEDIGQFNSNKAKPTSRDFKYVIKVNQDLFMAALRMLHPGKEVTLTFRHKNKNKYSRVSATPAYTTWIITIS